MASKVKLFYSVGDWVICKHKDMPYDCKIIGIKNIDSSDPIYVVHYTEWSSRYDEEVPHSLVPSKMYKPNDETVIKANVVPKTRAENMGGELNKVASSNESTSLGEMSEKDRLKIIHKFTDEINKIEADIDKNQKRLAESRKVYPEMCRGLFLEEKLARLAHIVEDPIKPLKPSTIDFSSIMLDIEKRFDTFKSSLENSEKFLKLIEQTNQEKELFEQRVENLANQILGVDF